MEDPVDTPWNIASHVDFAQATPSPTKKELRDLAYRILAGAMLGEEYPGEHREEAVAAAIEIVLADDRKTRSRSERSVQLWVGTAKMFAWLTDPEIIEAIETAGSVARGALLAAMGEDPT